MSEENLEILNAIIKDTQILLKDKKREGWKSFCASLSPNSNPSEVWNSIRRFRSVYRDQQFIVPESLAEEFIDTIAPPSVPSQLAYFPILKSVQMDHNYAILSTPFTLHELKGILSGVDDSAPGLDGIPYSFLTHLGDSALEYYLNIINVVLLTGNIPPQWKEQEVIPVLKPNKNPEEASSYRPIVLSSVLAKIAEHLVKNRIEWYIEHHNSLSKTQFGFRKGKSTMDNLSILTTDIRIAFSDNQHVIAVFLDINSAYDNVNIQILKNKLIKLQIPEILINL
ncbi:unnamed protein product [Colias eurytheme]|nr:unnamed protein product [Colias eurytheme]